MAAPRTNQAGSGVLDAIEGLASEIEHVQLRVTALERRMDTGEADPGPELVARRLPGHEAGANDGWERFERRAERLVKRLRALESAAVAATPA